ncbi:hypothetical protein AVT65_gp65 [Gordonia phage Gmala1]|uniref:Uncharacterized protein n=1 Tax=Gordonia phage Gmala1 TaxID=1622190 RepID=A0A0E3XBG3_9CAUD|nr:hypothetical protein AVT65_gp65 [Gordonia phage Gmala1]AKC02903.1 hypothetical protein Gmala1_65 [Gordonia phage Gmala1]
MAKHWNEIHSAKVGHSYCRNCCDFTTAILLDTDHGILACVRCGLAKNIKSKFQERMEELMKFTAKLAGKPYYTFGMPPCPRQPDEITNTVTQVIPVVN